ncbi:acyl-CoA dehydrogenase family protein [Lichenihabitans sp. PAMC28606]|uniref:acyl-CoA dehydrogenase family protein n=1 Tax=Lichenihabitans sp. PAMC28606 TaxID=2880932 RepID=UPI001D0B2771|nr:acyl-CoA dehydrogenase family protein [Lichenihabitans sp. PAMC28606]UDL95632.1 acyl-CoA dehydrogenase family protein [Lichenihabitans sp. PAMC28606]
MTHHRSTWGSDPSASYDALAERFRPVFQRIRKGAVAREIDRTLPYEQIRWLKEAGFGAIRVPREQGGAGATLPEVFALLAELAEADSNVTQALRAHFAYAEDVLNSADPERRARWFKRFVRGDLVGSAWTEIGPAKMAAFSTIVTRQDDRLLLNGAKFYTTGSIFADWIDVGAVDGEGETVSVIAAVGATGVGILDDWDGFGQKLTGSGTATFTNVPIAPEHVVPGDERFGYSAAFVQVVHLATLVGIARAAAQDAASAVSQRTRTYSHAAASRSGDDPQVLQVIGHLHGLAYAAGSIVAKTAEALQRSFEARHVAEDAEIANVAAEIEVAQAQPVVSALTLEATAVLFDALGASATSRAKSLDRYWRNARTISSHNPRIYKDRIVGDYVVNGTRPPFQWRIGQA